MALAKSLSLMGMSTVVRLLSGLIAFSIVARFLGPETFGTLMVLYSIATLASLVTNFGLVPYVLREIGANPQSTEQVIREGLTLKIALSLLVTAGAIIATALPGMAYPGAFGLLLLAAVADSFTEFFNAGFRAHGKFGIETRIATFTSLTHAGIVIGLVLTSPTIIITALAYAVSRLLVLGLTIHALARHVSLPRLAPVADAFRQLRGVGAYAADFGLQSLFGNIDSVVINHFVGPAAVGIYQAGMRVFQGGAVAIQVLANVFLPRVAALQGDSTNFKSECRRVQLSFLGVGALFGIAISVMSPWIVDILYGNSYTDLVSLFPFLGLLFFVRFSAAAWGIVLTAGKLQAYRTKATAVHWLVIFAPLPFLISRFGLSGWVIALIGGNFVLACLYAHRAARLVSFSWPLMAITAIGGCGFVPFLKVAG